jgi:hypothetical protein
MGMLVEDEGRRMMEVTRPRFAASCIDLTVVVFYGWVLCYIADNQLIVFVKSCDVVATYIHTFKTRQALP